jgi:hypothetical protein
MGRPLANFHPYPAHRRACNLRQLPNAAQAVRGPGLLCRLFAFREAPPLYFLRVDISKQLHLEPLDYRASFRRLVA